MSIRASLRSIVTSDATMLAIPGFLATMAAEYVALKKRPDLTGYQPMDTAANLAMGSGMLAIGVAASKVYKPLDNWLFSKRRRNAGGSPLALAGAVLAWDFLYYWDHRLGHTRRLFWAAHVNHHSSQTYNLSTALRQSWTGLIMHWIFTPMFAAGWSPSQVARAGEINLLYQYWVHTETIDKLSPAFEKIFNTPSHHRVHHGTNQQYLDRNYGGIFIFWDRIFGSFEPEGEPVNYGLTKNISTHNPVRIAGHEWAALAKDLRNAQSWQERLGYTFGPPGWEPQVAVQA